MSRSQPQLTNPGKHFFRWSGEKGTLSYWDKENEQEVEVKLPFEFLPIDQLATITGFCEQDKSSYWSNEVRTLRDEFTVKTSAGTKQVGLYKDLADVRAKGAKYAKSIYIVYKFEDEWVIGNIKAHGACLTAWIEFNNKHKVENGKVILTGSTEGTKGKTVYQIPTFEYVSCTKEENDVSIELDKELQIYLSQYLAATVSEEESLIQSGDRLGEEDIVYDAETGEPIN